MTPTLTKALVVNVTNALVDGIPFPYTVGGDVCDNHTSSLCPHKSRDKRPHEDITAQTTHHNEWQSVYDEFGCIQEQRLVGYDR
ncbi:unnamed protein product, partial [Oppiella nova]